MWLQVKTSLTVDMFWISVHKITACSVFWSKYIMQVDNYGTVNLVEACRKRGINRFILISSILVNGAAMGQLLNPSYIILNVFGLVLIAKLQAEQYIRKSGINYTIIRPGGLRNDPPSGNIVMEPEVRQWWHSSANILLCFSHCCRPFAACRILCSEVQYLEIK